MVSKIVTILSILALPLSCVLWYTSHTSPRYHRYDVTLYKSLWVYLNGGVCGLHLLSMPTKTASRTEFHALVQVPSIPKNRSLLLTSKKIRTKRGHRRATWIVFPLWLSTTVLALGSTVPLAIAPVRQWRRRRNGWCLTCGYDLRGNRSGRCPECGTRLRRPVRPVRRPHAQARFGRDT